MIAEKVQQPNELDYHFSMGWKLGFPLALLITVATVPIHELPKWYAIIPCLVGVMLAVVVIAFTPSRPLFHRIPYPPDTEPGGGVVRFSSIQLKSGPEPLSDAEVANLQLPVAAYVGKFWMALRSKPAADSDQKDLFQEQVPERGQRNKIHRLVTDKGAIYVIAADRWMELLTTRVLDTTDKATDHALAMAVKACPTPPGVGVLEIFTKQFREVMKCDFRGNMVKVIALEGEDLARELSAKAEAAKESQDQPFLLEPLEASETAPLPKRRKK